MLHYASQITRERISWDTIKIFAKNKITCLRQSSYNLRGLRDKEEKLYVI
jgi:hypothetical protein